MIKKIIKTVDGVSPKLATKIFHSATSVYPLDRNLLLDINEVIIRKKLTDLSQINERVLAAFKCLFNDNTTTRVPQTVVRLPIPTNSENHSASSSVENSPQARQTKSQYHHNQQNKDYHENRQRDRRKCDFSTGKISINFDSDTGLDECYFEPSLVQVVNRTNENVSAPNSSSSSRESSVFTDNQYIPQHIVPENR